MSAPIRRGDDQGKDDMVLRYAPPWVRERRQAGAGSARIAASPPTVPEMEEVEPEFEPLPSRFEGDVAMEAVRRRLSLEPQSVPEPPIRLRRARRLPLWIGRFVGACILAAGAAFGITWLTAPHIATRDAPAARDAVTSTAIGVAHGAMPVDAPPPATVKSERLVPAVGTSRVESDRGEVVVPPAPAFAPPATTVEPKVEEPPAVQRLDPEEIAALLRRGQALLKTGDIAAARLLLRRAANAGSAEAALALGGTYDGAILAELGVVGFAPENAEALFWYRKAAEGGASEAERRLGRLRSRGE